MDAALWGDDDKPGCIARGLQESVASTLGDGLTLVDKAPRPSHPEPQASTRHANAIVSFPLISHLYTMAVCVTWYYITLPHPTRVLTPSDGF
jgi:hypothetical protein